MTTTTAGPESTLWLASDAAAAIGAELHAAGDTPISGVSIDSRTVSPGDIFFAIKGDRFDGHDFAKMAVGAGARFAVVARDRRAEIDLDDQNVLIVEDVLQAMEALACAARDRLRRSHKAKVVGVTGSVGKTGTKEALRLSLSACGKTHASLASFNNHWGVPLTLSRTPSDIDFGVYEIGMNHAGEIEHLVDMVRPDIAIITTVGPVHLEFFENEEGIARAKAEIFSGLEPDGYAVLNADNHHFPLLSDIARDSGASIVAFGEASGADVRLVSVDLNEDSSDVSIDLMGTRYAYRLGAPGRHIVQNSLAVAAALHLVGADVNTGLEALSGLSAPKGRGARHRLKAGKGALTLLDESYNANPTSMRAALSLLGSTEPDDDGRRIAVLGDMLELGPESDTLHAGLSDAVLNANVKRAYLCGTHMAFLADRLSEKISVKYADQSAGLEESLLAEVAEGDVVMVKGSLGSRMGRLVEALQRRFPPEAL
ncbi:MAG: UDP-N-acetylmuramoylalanyl-D-glutamyl-2,6-diaminopimelate--D-alanyl-D-alanine ligase [Pseudomonadota bacterium]